MLVLSQRNQRSAPNSCVPTTETTVECPKFLSFHDGNKKSGSSLFERSRSKRSCLENSILNTSRSHPNDSTQGLANCSAAHDGPHQDPKGTTGTESMSKVKDRGWIYFIEYPYFAKKSACNHSPADGVPLGTKRSVLPTEISGGVANWGECFIRSGRKV
jgi:hypothetical protein